MEHITWILVADAATARIFSAHKARLFQDHKDGKDLTLISEHQHTDSRKTDQELVSDKNGKFGYATFQQETDPKRHAEDCFAMELAKVLNTGREANHFQDMICIAPPAFMGMINKHLPATVSRLVSLSIEKDYTRHTPKDLVQNLQDYL